MKKLFFLFFISSCALFSCKKEEPVYYPAYYNNGQYYPYPYPYPNYVPDTNRFFLPVTNQNVNGYTTYYYANSNVKISEGHYQNGIPSGYWKIYYSNGKMMREGNYSNGALSGYWKFYYDNGRLKEEGNYANSVRSGTWKFYYPNGILSAEGNYSNGAPQGEWRYYGDNGVMTSTVTY